MTLQASGLAGGRGQRTLFSGIELAVGPGEALQVAGRNGSGKTTLLRLLCGLLEPLAGEVRWRGERLHEQRDRLHRDLIFIGHAQGLKGELSALENVRVSAALAGHPCTRAQALQALAEVDLAARAHLPAQALSQGQRRRVVLARLAWQRSAGLLVLDEPFNALDPESLGLVGSLIGRQLAEGAALVYTTHQAQQVVAARRHTLELGPPGMREAA
ncbi:MAG: cytochrome c biogenesis heme-transporting ATPase CcmA [Burkholderiales bacterium]|nr:cytochrome c biogenesis heme-transporting ATPase CcmA [Burkholderiales bacterium]MBH2014944.1 cytochrome c biogenesis heme-transporting ATPase CcmA [Burkholderiales bacterium]